MKDFFISFTGSDRPWAEWIAWELEEAGYSVVFQDWDFGTGSDFVLKMQQAVKGSERTVAVISPSYFAAKFTQPEWTAAFAQDPLGERQTLVPVRVADFQVEGMFAPRVYIDLVGISEETARDRIIDGVRIGRRKPLQRPIYPPTRTAPGFPGTASSAASSTTTMAQSSSQSAVLDRVGSGGDAIDEAGFRGGRSLEDVVADLKAAKGFPIRLLLLGRTGVGKSSMINALFGGQVAPVGDWRPTTLQVDEYHKEINGIQVEVTDTPGLCDDIPEVGNDEKYLAQLLGRRRKFDCVLFVTPLNERRMRSDERRAIALITEILGAKIWRHSVIVLTHGDTVGASQLQTAKAERSALLRSEIVRWAPSLDPMTIPAVVTSTNDQLPDGREWLGELFTVVLQRMKDTAGKAFLLAAANRIRPAGASRSGSESSVDNVKAPTAITLNAEQQAALAEKVDEWYPGFTVTGALAGYAIAGEVGAVLGAAGGALMDVFSWLFR